MKITYIILILVIIGFISSGCSTRIGAPSIMKDQSEEVSILGKLKVGMSKSEFTDLFKPTILPEDGTVVSKSKRTALGSTGYLSLHWLNISHGPDTASGAALVKGFLGDGAAGMMKAYALDVHGGPYSGANEEQAFYRPEIPDLDKIEKLFSPDKYYFFVRLNYLETKTVPIAFWKWFIKETTFSYGCTVAFEENKTLTAMVCSKGGGNIGDKNPPKMEVYFMLPKF
jgi:hypothetical protein